jgi:hypothetical protein
MKTYARIDSGKVAELFSTDGDITKMFHPSMVWVDVTSATPAPQVGWSATQTAGAWTFAVPAGPSAATLWQQYQAQAQAALSKSDITIWRCTENAVAVPAAWATYRAALRAIISAATGDPTKSLPVRPAYPVGT